MCISLCPCLHSSDLSYSECMLYVIIYIDIGRDNDLISNCYKTTRDGTTIVRDVISDRSTVGIQWRVVA